jgi:hypothetical protein
MAIICGNCRKNHEAVADVKACYAGTGSVASPSATETAYRANRYAGTCADCGAPVAAEAGRLEGTRGSWSVRCLPGKCGTVSVKPLELPVKRDVPAGHYATASLTGNNDLDFWRVDRPEQGRHAGRTFVKRVIGGRPESPVHGSTRYAALEAIVAAGIDEAGFRYAKELGRCRRCNRHLTDELSRSLGIGPDCRALTGA